MGLFYTKKGDKGFSHIGKKKVYKLDLFVVALGELDELNSLIGVVKSQRISPTLKNNLHQVQENLFIIQANVAYAMLKEKRIPPFFSSAKTEEIERLVDGIEKKLKPARGFVISGSTSTSAWLDYLRALSRSVERSVLAFARDPAPNFSADHHSEKGRVWGGAGKKGKLVINTAILPYLNRLSSLFFALARWEGRGKKEKHPVYK